MSAEPRRFGIMIWLTTGKRLVHYVGTNIKLVPKELGALKRAINQEKVSFAGAEYGPFELSIREMSKDFKYTRPRFIRPEVVESFAQTYWSPDVGENGEWCFYGWELKQDHLEECWDPSLLQAQYERVGPGKWVKKEEAQA